MTHFWKMNVYVTGEEYETREFLIDEPTFRKYQKAISQGVTHLVLEDKIIKTSLIKEILPADDIVKEYLSTGVTYKSLGLREPLRLNDAKIQGELTGINKKEIERFEK